MQYFINTDFIDTVAIQYHFYPLPSCSNSTTITPTLMSKAYDVYQECTVKIQAHSKHSCCWYSYTLQVYRLLKKALKLRPHHFPWQPHDDVGALWISAALICRHTEQEMNILIFSIDFRRRISIQNLFEKCKNITQQRNIVFFEDTK